MNDKGCNGQLTDGSFTHDTGGVGGQRAGNESRSSQAESEGSSLPEYTSVTTPGLVSSVCGLLGNLVCLAPQDTLMCLQREGIVTTLLRYLSHVCTHRREGV